MPVELTESRRIAGDESLLVLEWGASDGVYVAHGPAGGKIEIVGSDAAHRALGRAISETAGERGACELILMGEADPSTRLRTGPSTRLRTGPSTGLRTSPSTGLRTSPSTGLRTSGPLPAA